MNNGAVRFDALDSWRGIVAVFVALFLLDPIGYFFNFPLIRNGNLAAPFLLALCYIFAVVVCACFTYYLVELPGLVNFSKLSKHIGAGREACGQGAYAS